MKNIYHGTSKIDGMGVRAGENIPKNKVIARIKGELKFKVNKNKKDALSNPDWVGVKKDIWIDPEKPYKFLNHSCSPSAGIRGLTIISIRAIQEGEEITIDYSTIEGDKRWTMLCKCKEKKCRGVIRSIEYLTPDQFNQIPYIPAYFRKLYIESRKNLSYNGKKLS